MSVMGRVRVLVRLPKPWKLGTSPIFYWFSHKLFICFLSPFFDSLQTYEVRNNNPISGSNKGRHHLPVEEGPGRLSVKTKHHRSIFGTLVHKVHPWEGHTTAGLNKRRSWQEFGNLHRCCSSWGQKCSQVFPGLQISTQGCEPQWEPEMRREGGRWESKDTSKGVEQVEPGGSNPR